MVRTNASEEEGGGGGGAGGGEGGEEEVVEEEEEEERVPRGPLSHLHRPASAEERGQLRSARGEGIGEAI